ncbi:MAG: S1 RNA-binding domain-containing protein [Zetaproteobacteria bacterium]|nr:S1 RNA-binding domain-containing protein [Zetaproteobacteria bacterium]
MAKNHIPVNWEDEEMGEASTPVVEDAFAKMLESSAEELERAEEMRSQSLQVGAEVRGVVSYKPAVVGDILLDLGGKSVGILPQDALSEDLRSTLKVGDVLQAYVQSVTSGEVVLSTSLTASQAGKQALETAYAAKLPVKGRVVKVNKGGFEVELMGGGKRSAFCPISQISNQYTKDPTTHLNREYTFLITKLAVRDCVVSRRELMEKEARARLEELTKIAADESHVIRARVTEILPAGVVVDLGSYQSGFIHISELSHGHLESPESVVQPGEMVQAKILQVDRQHPKGPRVSLSVKAVLGDPWEREQLLEQYPVESSHQGHVTRLTPFGAFVSLEPGIEGLVHISEMSWTKRISHPKELLQAGQKVQVRVCGVDTVAKKMSLSLKDLSEDPWAGVAEEFAVDTLIEAPVVRLEGFGAFVALKSGVEGLLPARTLRIGFGESFRKKAAPGASLKVKVIACNPDDKKILLGLADLDHVEEAEKAYAEYLCVQEKAQREKDTRTSGTFGDLLRQKMKR